MAVKINTLELENVKRIKAVKMEPSQNGLTIVGGRNNQGKTSVLDAIAWALGGDDFRPSQAQREGTSLPPNLKVTLSNGIVVERKGKNSALKVTDPSGQKSGQRLLNSFIEKLALNLPKFMNASNPEKAKILLQIIGLDDQIKWLDNQEKKLYDERLYVGRNYEAKQKYSEALDFYPEAPNELVSIADLIQEQQKILAKNGENQRKRNQVKQLEFSFQQGIERINSLRKQIENLQKELQAENDKVAQIGDDLETAKLSAEALQDQSTKEIENSIANIEIINQKVRKNAEKEKASIDAEELKKQYNELTLKIDNVRKDRLNLLKDADLPLEGLSVDHYELTYKGQKWDNMSGSDQLKVATAIIRKLNPECGFVLVDKLEQMDQQTLDEFGAWLEREGLQVIGTRVSVGDECSIIIEDGYSVEKENKEKPDNEKQLRRESFRQWKF